MVKNNKIKSIIHKSQKSINGKCVKNHPFLYSVLKKFNPLETILLRAIRNNPTGFSQIKNPYFYGEVSISRTARHFPAIVIFKTLIILSSFLLFLYWKNNLNLFNELKNNSILVKFSKNIMSLENVLFMPRHVPKGTKEDPDNPDFKTFTQEEKDAIKKEVIELQKFINKNLGINVKLAARLAILASSGFRRIARV